MKNIKSINEYFDYETKHYTPNYKKGYIKIHFYVPPASSQFKTYVDFDKLFSDRDKEHLPPDEYTDGFERRYKIKFVGRNETYEDYYNFKTEEGKELETLKNLSKLSCIEDADFVETNVENIENSKWQLVMELENLDEPYKMGKDEWNKKIEELIAILQNMKLK